MAYYCDNSEGQYDIFLYDINGDVEYCPLCGEPIENENHKEVDDYEDDDITDESYDICKPEDFNN